MCKHFDDQRNEVFSCAIVSEDETKSVETSFTIGELEDTVKRIGKEAVTKEDPVALKIASVLAYMQKQHIEVHKERTVEKARREAFVDAVKEALEIKDDKKFREVIEGIVETDSELSDMQDLLMKILQEAKWKK